MYGAFRTLDSSFNARSLPSATNRRHLLGRDEDGVGYDIHVLRTGLGDRLNENGPCRIFRNERCSMLVH